MTFTISTMELWGVIVAIFLGALIGLQREYTQQHVHLKRFAGFRTFVLITFFGAMLGFLSGGINTPLVTVGFVAIILLSVSSYVVTYMRTKSTASTTEIAALMSYILGVMTTTGYIQFAVIFGILIVTFLAFKERFHHFAKKMDKKEMFAVVKFALISLVILPILPNRNYSPADVPGLNEVLLQLGVSADLISQLNVFNPYNIWMMVILVAGISFLGYFLVKIIGSKKGYGILGFVGGLVSSTAVTLSMASESKKNKKLVFPFVLATVIATCIMFIRIVFEVAIVNSSLLNTLVVPMLSMCAFGLFIVFIFYKRRHKEKQTKEVKFEQPFAIVPALKFGMLFALILFVSKIAQVMFGSTGIYITSVLSGLTDVDAITLTMSALSKSGSISNFVASTAIILAAASNTFVKAGMAYYLGSRKFGNRILLAFILILLVGVGILLF